MDKQLLKGSTEMLILASLAEGSKHGYLITKYLRDHSDGEFQFSAGMLYPLLHKLEKKKFISGSWDSASGERKRKLYALTLAGKSWLQSKKADWEHFSHFISKVIHAA